MPFLLSGPRNLASDPQQYHQQEGAATENSPVSPERIVFNVSGLVFETYATTLHRFPSTLLGDPVKRATFFDPHRGHYFFDRHRESFESILFYYQSNGLIQRPLTVSLAVFLEEVKFFQLGEKVIRILLRDEGLKSVEDILLPDDAIRRNMWLFVEYPLSSCYARWFYFFSMTMILISVASFCLETLPMFITYHVDISSSVPKFTTDNIFFKEEFFYLELACMVWFTIEIVIRFYSCPNRYLFFKSALNILDIASILPFYALVVMMCFEIPITSPTVYLRFFRFLRLFRVVRVLKLSRHSKGLQVLAKTMVTSGRELTLLLFFVIVCVVLFATAVYYAELDSRPNSFTSIPDSFWWAVVTMTTVGYGDMRPQTMLGKFVGCLCAVAGVLTIALPVPVIVSNFNYFYVKEKENEELINYAVLNRRRVRENNSSSVNIPKSFDRTGNYDEEITSVTERDALYVRRVSNWPNHSQTFNHIYREDAPINQRKHSR
ncbi:Potassium voltage-gated channel subfamily A member [Echinococcus granulosus]|uniref:Potassium voltage gated channel subfamily A n=1 Tax=Echinococcus granulosus TaxID=6210 RepID=U6J049_ECHGR|nr:Potassium voltage-gated channel subfamily A member [Echinococcus granulosus]EUB64192.1 Potassium voltage-gated channel subfamily A member [Echinococcus granulosus]CDS17437.1 potassium voltage gated channel subfamily A [Echinococcus granulosus]